MTVELSDWIATINRHPLSFTFDGLRGHGPTPMAVARNDERYMEERYRKEVEDAREALEREIAGDRCTDFLEHYARDLSHDVAEDAPDGDAYVLIGYVRSVEARIHKHRQRHRSLDEAADSLRSEFIEGWVSYDWVGEGVEGSDLEYMLEQHPIEGVWDHAADCEIALKEVFFICPGCGRQPIEYSTGRLTNGYYCGLCGAENDQGKGKTMLDFFEALQVQPFPFSRKRRDWLEQTRPLLSFPEGWEAELEKLEEVMP
jgi:predicted RNA-binding Zn-ribbon protein involved in translation (DUF1610 family)